MPIPTTARVASVTVFPAAEVEKRLRREIERLGKESEGMREPWEPTFDSLAVVNVVVAVEDLLPNFKIAPEKVVRKGGYKTADEAAKDITKRLGRDWEEQHR